MHWTNNRKTNEHTVSVAGLPFEMVVYEQPNKKNTVVITCRSAETKRMGNLTYANSIQSAKIQAEELIKNGRWVEFTPEYLTQPVQTPITRITKPKLVQKVAKPVVKPQASPVQSNLDSCKLQELVNKFSKG